MNRRYQNKCTRRGFFILIILINFSGALKDSTGYWDAAFYVAGIWVIVSGFLVGVIPFTKNFRIIGNAPLAKDVAVDPEPGVKIIIAH